MTEPEKPAPRVSSLPMFLIAQKPDGRLAIREVCGSCGQSLMNSARQSGRYSCVWLAAAFQGATGSAS